MPMNTTFVYISEEQLQKLASGGRIEIEVTKLVRDSYRIVVQVHREFKKKDKE